MIISQEDFIQLASSLMQGVASNPVSANKIDDGYNRQCMISSVLSDLTMGLSMAGVSLELREEPEIKED